MYYTCLVFIMSRVIHIITCYKEVIPSLQQHLQRRSIRFALHHVCLVMRPFIRFCEAGSNKLSPFLHSSHKCRHLLIVTSRVVLSFLIYIYSHPRFKKCHSSVCFVSFIWYYKRTRSQQAIFPSPHYSKQIPCRFNYQHSMNSFRTAVSNISWNLFYTLRKHFLFTCRNNYDILLQIYSW